MANLIVFGLILALVLVLVHSDFSLPACDLLFFCIQLYKNTHSFSVCLCVLLVCEGLNMALTNVNALGLHAVFM